MIRDIQFPKWKSDVTGWQSFSHAILGIKLLNSRLYIKVDFAFRWSKQKNLSVGRTAQCQAVSAPIFVTGAHCREHIVIVINPHRETKDQPIFRNLWGLEICRTFCKTFITSKLYHSHAGIISIKTVLDLSFFFSRRLLFKKAPSSCILQFDYLSMVLTDIVAFIPIPAYSLSFQPWPGNAAEQTAYWGVWLSYWQEGFRNTGKANQREATETEKEEPRTEKHWGKFLLETVTEISLGRPEVSSYSSRKHIF